MYNFQNDNRQFDAIDGLSVFSAFIGYLNLLENRQQSAQNDVNAANDKQAKQILDEIGARLDRQDAMLQKIFDEISKKNSN